MKRIAVVGAGVFGSWTALLAVRAGFEAILIDCFGPASEFASSGGASRIIRRAYGADEIYTLLAQRSLDLWIPFLTAVDRSRCFVRTGVLWMARESDASIYAARRIFERHRILHEFLDTLAIGARYRRMDVPEGAVALLEPDSGALRAEESVRAVAESAIRNGARYINTRVKPLAGPDSPRFLDLEGHDRIDADIFVFACGSWLPKLFPDLLGNAIFPTRQEVFFFNPGNKWSQPDAASLPIWVDQTDPRIPYGFPDLDGAGIKIAFHRNGPRFDPDSGSRDIAPEHVIEAAEYLRLRFPSIGQPAFRSAHVCHYENTSSGDLLIDRHPSMHNVWFAGGGSGHGFKHGPAVAEYLLDAIQKHHSPEPRFRLEGKGPELARRVI
jgi:sarcosine oxidase